MDSFVCKGSRLFWERKKWFFGDFETLIVKDGLSARHHCSKTVAPSRTDAAFMVAQLLPPPAKEAFFLG